MRIIAGSLRGRRLRVPGHGVRPTSDRVREALFARLDCDGAAVLDLYAGSGALGLEALSRGAAHVVFVERSAAVRRVLADNIESLGMTERARVVAGSASSALRRGFGASAPFDLVFLDPPYAASDELAGALAGLSNVAFTRSNTMLVVESPKRHSLTLPAGLSLLDERCYGDTRVSRVIGRGEAGDATRSSIPAQDDP